MDLTYTPEQERLRQQLRAYFTGLMTPDVRAALTAAEGEYGNGEAYRQVVRQLGRDGWLALSWPRGVRGPRRVPARPAHLHRRGGHRRGARTLPDDQHGGPDDHALRHRRSRRRTTCPGSPPARSTSRSGTPSRRRAPTWPRCAPAPSGTGTCYVINGQKMWTSLIAVRRLRVAGLPDRPGGAPPQGPVHPHRPHQPPRLLLDAGAHHRRDHHERHLLLRRPRARLRPGRRARTRAGR